VVGIKADKVLGVHFPIIASVQLYNSHPHHHLSTLQISITMRLSTILPLIAASAASARIIGIAAPSTIAPNSTFSLTLLVENYIQAVADVSVAWGFSPVPGYPDSLGTLGSGSGYLGPAKSNTRTNVTVAAKTPVSLEVGKQYVLSASVFR
jgi:hypothetical protein